jgi:hypothetical protein
MVLECQSRAFAEDEWSASMRGMAESNDRKELERRLEQAKRIANLPVDPLTQERLQRLVRELEEQLRLSTR